MMKKLLMPLVLLLVLTCAAAEGCGVCGGDSPDCLTDEYGAVYCSGTLVSYPMEIEQTAAHYTVREGTRIIGEGAFDNQVLRSVVLPDSVVMIGEGAFWDCISLEFVKLPDSLLIIGDNAFRGCAALRHVNDMELPSGLVALGSGAFANCRSLYELDVPSSVRFFGDEVFAGAGLADLYLYSTRFVYGKNVLPEHEVVIHMPGEAPTGVIPDFMAAHPQAVLRLDLAEEEW